MLVLEIQDTALWSLTGSGEPCALGPGIASFRDERLVFGAAAADRSRSPGEPFHDAYWLAPDGAPAGPGFPPGETRGSLAHQHLVAILEYLDVRGPTLLALPGHVRREGMAHLLGIAAATGLEVRGLLDSGLASVRHALDPELMDIRPTTRVVFIDLHRHAGTVSTFRVAHDGHRATIVREAIGTSEALALPGWEAAMVDAIAKSFVHETRFDPLHTAETERALHEAMPEWLAAMAAGPTTLSLGGYSIRADESLPARAVADRWDQLEAMIETPGETILLSDRLGGLPGRPARLAGAHLLPPEAAVRGTLALGPDPRIAEGISFRTRLTMTARAPVRRRDGTVPLIPSRRPTHILHENRARPLTGGSFDLIAALGLGMEDARALLRVGADLVTLEALEGGVLNGAPLTGPRVLSVGDRIEIGEVGLVLIEVVS